MGFDYALVHIKYTLPPAIALTLLYRPLLQRIDVYKILFLVTIAVVSATPWDSYLIRNQIWTYPPNAVLGPKLFLIPIEEVFFFLIQTYITSLLYMIFNKPLFHPTFLVDRGSAVAKTEKRLLGRTIQTVLVLLFIAALVALNLSAKGKYLALILLWALPFTFFLWSLSYSFLLNLPTSSTLLPIVLPTFYLWLVDTIALKKGTWMIASGTKLNIYLWEGLEIEEAIFFLATNILVVFGLVAFDYSITIIQSFPNLFASPPELPSPILLMKALMIDSHHYDGQRIAGFQSAVERLKKKSRTFYLASATFSGRMRIDLILLYSFYRVADDLVDNAETETEARQWINKLTKFLELAYLQHEKKHNISKQQATIQKFVEENFPHSSQSALQFLPTRYLSPKPFYDLLDGFKTDLNFLKLRHGKLIDNFPIINEQDLELYALQVAGTVAESFLELAFYHTRAKTSLDQRKRLQSAATRMGVALQYVNISRDIETDAKIGRVYIPALWLKDEGITCEQILTQPFGLAVEKMRDRLLALAFKIYHEALGEMVGLPPEVRSPMKVAVESYMEIARVLTEKNYQKKDGRAIIPIWRRLRVAWRALSDYSCF
ncbi:Bifunctional lycopene cyclase/phytoene synthase [Erysiphe neolycopersici]|uniref:Bifunctional lycopene cyclase/phytoene synthase n=1 Tax=Erysiphe neolycopersici TaxID=212602 RepID=A0A420HFB6_9PEZI|nr:Bifunctional lycopene cyclase/phytoene synthase [Erysiphe neolycopersici]